MYLTIESSTEQTPGMLVVSTSARSRRRRVGPRKRRNREGDFRLERRERGFMLHAALKDADVVLAKLQLSLHGGFLKLEVVAV